MSPVTIAPTLEELRALFLSDLPPKQRLAAAQSVIANEGGAMRRLQRLTADRDRWGYGVHQAAQADGYEVLAGQQGWGLFNPGRRADLTQWVFNQLEPAPDLVPWVEEILAGLGRADAQLELFLVPGDAANAALMNVCQGLSVHAQPGVIAIQVWPDEGNLHRLRANLARAITRAIRFEVAGPPKTLADHLAAEGLASQCAGSWVAPFARPDGYDATLQEIADRYGLPHYDDLEVNIYGNKLRAGDRKAPEAQPLPTDELAYSRQVIWEHLGSTDARTIAAALYGDELVGSAGHPTLGLSPYAGFQVAHKAVGEQLTQVDGRAIGLVTRALLSAP
jgi:hypothetical protein